MLRNTFRVLFSSTFKFAVNTYNLSHNKTMPKKHRNNRGFHTSHGQNWNWQGNRDERPKRKRSVDDRRISIKLSYILRHGAHKMNLPIDNSGFIYVNDLLRRREYRHVEEEDIIRIVENNDKQRFSLRYDSHNNLKIGANQGHTIRCENLQLVPITDAKSFPCVVHGTTHSAWHMIKETGLKTMGRNHIHFASGEPGEAGVISGMRSSCQVLIYINLKKALKKGIKFFLSKNNVILSPGDKDGMISSCFFKSTIDRQTRKHL